MKTETSSSETSAVAVPIATSARLLNVEGGKVARPSVFMALKRKADVQSPAPNPRLRNQG